MKRKGWLHQGLLALAAAVAVAVAGGTTLAGAPLVPDETPAVPGEWGFRPFDGQPVTRNPPAFVWRPQKEAATYQLALAPDPALVRGSLAYTGLIFNACCPTQALSAGVWHWRFRYATARGMTSEWSRVRTFRLDGSATVFPLPSRAQVLARLPVAHPRLFVRPEQVAALRSLANGARAADFAALTRRCDRLLKQPPPSAEPPLYPEGLARESDEWMKMWWGNREYTIAALDGAATLGFAHRLGGNPAYGQLARRLLLDAAAWDPRGSTGFKYNDEAGLPFMYHFARTYTFVHDLLTAEERTRCQAVVAVRGRDMYEHLSRKQFWQPYESHANRAWHKLGEAAIAFHGEVPEAADWLWFVINKQFCTYPVWNDDDGGWHEGSSYWCSYIGRFAHWADALRTATGVDVFALPYFAKIGYYPLYLLPPGAPAGGMGDLCDRAPGRGIAELAGDFASLTGNGHWQWYAEQAGARPPAKPRPGAEMGYLEFLRGGRKPVTPVAPTNLPSSIVFRGIGQAVLNTDLTASSNNVEIVFKSSPFGTHSHGYDAQNSFLLYAYGERLLIPTGRRDQYGSAHHRDWMWATKSVNSITFDDGEGQGKRTMGARGRLTGFHTSPALDYVAGEAAEAYGGKLDRFARHVVFVKPDLIVIYDELCAPAPHRFEWRLHAPVAMDVRAQGDIAITNGRAACRVAFLAPAGLELRQTDQFDVPPRPKIKLREWHLTATAPEAAAQQSFVTVVRPYRVSQPAPGPARLEQAGGRFVVTAETARGAVRITLAQDAANPVEVVVTAPDGRRVAALRAADAALTPAPAVATGL